MFFFWKEILGFISLIYTKLLREKIYTYNIIVRGTTISKIHIVEYYSPRAKMLMVCVEWNAIAIFFSKLE